MKARAYFHSENISFRPLKEEHIPLVYKLHSLPEVAQFNTIGIPESEAKTAKILVQKIDEYDKTEMGWVCLLYTSPSPRDISGSRMPSSA